MSAVAQPYDLMTWDGEAAPTRDLLERLMRREGLTPVGQALSPGKTQEMKFKAAVVWVVVSGTLYVSFPGYGSVDLSPGDILEVHPGILHDITVTGQTEAIVLSGEKP